MSVWLTSLIIAAVWCTTPTPSATDACVSLRNGDARVEWSVEDPVPATLKRPALLSALYVTYTGVQVFDLYTTSESLRRGGREVNPVVAPLAGNLVAFSALKAATSIGTIYCVDRLWRRHRVAAVIMMAGLNGAVGAVAAHNAGVARRARAHTGGGR